MKKLCLTLGVILSLFLSCYSVNAQVDKLPVDISDLEINPVTREIYLERQEILLNQIDEGIIVINSSYGFDGGRHVEKTAPNFHYLTGINETGCVLVLSKEGGYSLYCPEENNFTTIYHGVVRDDDKIKNLYGVDEVFSKREYRSFLSETVRKGTPIYMDFNDEILASILKTMVKERAGKPSMIKNIKALIAELRLIKDDHEIALMQKAVDITQEAFTEVCKACKPGLYEFEMEAIIEYNFLKHGSTMPAFQSIVGSGKNSTILHYSASNKLMEAGELLLLDIGAEYGYYAADISRTIPVNGSFSKEQKDIYALVLKAQESAIEEMKPGSYILSGHKKAQEVIMQGLAELGLVTDPKSDWQNNFYTLYRAVHYLGLDVHDVGSYSRANKKNKDNKSSRTLGRGLEEGMVLTIEPGIYFRENGLEQLYNMYGKPSNEKEIAAFIEEVGPVYELYKNIGVRIEDDVLITEEGNRVLSKDIPKEISEIEDLMK